MESCIFILYLLSPYLLFLSATRGPLYKSPGYIIILEILGIRWNIPKEVIM